MSMSAAVLRWVPILAALCALGGPACAGELTPLRIGLTPVILDDQVGFLGRFRAYLEGRLGRPVQFLQRGSYREIVELLRGERLDFAWVCGFPYVRNRDAMRLLAVPVYGGQPLYRSYLIVPAGDTRTRSILDLRGKVFAYSDPDSNSGFLFPQFELLRLRERPASFFAKTFFTWSHGKVVEAVAVGLANGGAVDGYVWETLSRRHPELTGRTRIVAKSPEFGFPPFVARTGVAQGDYQQLQDVLFAMRTDPDGAAILGTLNLEGFVQGDDALFDGIARMAREVGTRQHASVP